jgi:hypothetical protein
MPTVITTNQFISQPNAERQQAYGITVLLDHHVKSGTTSSIFFFYKIWYRRYFIKRHDNLHSAIKKNSEGVSDKIDSQFRVLKLCTVG